MPYLEISGGLPLYGTVRASGSKNAVLPMMAASILADGPVKLLRAPRLEDVNTLSLVLRRLGVAVDRSQQGDLTLATVDRDPIRAEFDLVRRMRASFCVLGPLLARRGQAVVSLPGGCNIGSRPVDLHLKGLAALGADLHLRHGYIVARAKRLRGARIDLTGPAGSTVTGTANVLSAAVRARGVTTIHGAAQEPEIVDLGNCLCAMGARISGLGTSTLRIDGVEQLSGTAWRVIPDRIEAATLLLAVAITGGSATVAGVVPEHLTSVLEKLRTTGAKLDVGDDRVTLTADGPPQPVDVTARPYPGVPTDVQAQFTALLSIGSGRSVVRDTVFPERFMHVAELNRLGAGICCRGGAAAIPGVGHLSGAAVTASDLRASAALVLAGLAAKGRTRIHQARLLDRGYNRLGEKLRRLGADVSRLPRPRRASQAVAESCATRHLR